MTVKTRSVAERTGAGLEPLGAANLAGEQIFADQLLQWTLEGKCFIGSLEPETGGIGGQTTLSDEAHDFMLTSDRGGLKLVVPITTTISLFTDNNATGEISVRLNLVRPHNDTATLRTISGTAAHIISSRSDTYNMHTASMVYTVTSSALLQASEWCEIGFWKARAETIEATEHGFSDHTITVNHLKEGAPIILQRGASLSTTAASVTTAVATLVTYTWAELDASAYRP